MLLYIKAYIISFKSKRVSFQFYFKKINETTQPMSSIFNFNMFYSWNPLVFPFWLWSNSNLTPECLMENLILLNGEIFRTQKKSLYEIFQYNLR